MKWGLLVVVFFCVFYPAAAVIIRYDTPDEEYLKLARKPPFNAVGMIKGPTNYGSATLIEVPGRDDLRGKVILTALHNFPVQNATYYFQLENNKVKVAR